MTNIQKLNYELNKQVKKQGLVNAKVKVEEYEDAKQDISACIDPRNWEIKVTLKSGYEPIQDSKQKAYAKWVNSYNITRNILSEKINPITYKNQDFLKRL